MKNVIKKISISYNILAFLFIIGIKKSFAVTVKITNPIATNDFSTLISNILKWVLSIAGSLALLMLIAGGVFYIISTGDEQKVTSAKKMVTWAIIGLAVILASYSIILVLNTILT